MVPTLFRRYVTEEWVWTPQSVSVRAQEEKHMSYIVFLKKRQIASCWGFNPTSRFCGVDEFVTMIGNNFRLWKKLNYNIFSLLTWERQHLKWCHNSQQKRLRRFRGVKPTATSIVQASVEATQPMAAGRIIKVFKGELVDPHQHVQCAGSCYYMCCCILLWKVNVTNRCQMIKQRLLSIWNYDEWNTGEP